MNTRTTQHAPASSAGRPAAGNGRPPPPTARRSAFSPPQLAFLIGVPLAWAVLLWFHPSVARDDVYGSLRDQVATYQVVHVGTLIFIGLMGVALYLLVRDLPGKAARISRLAIGPFVLLYGAWEAVIGLATAALVQHANDVPPGERPLVSDAIQSLQDNVIVGDPGVVGGIGALAWIVAVIAAAVAVRHAGAPVLATVLLGLSLVVVSHPPPIGPIGLACFAGAVLVLHHDRRIGASRTAQAVPAVS
jgi:hypothetical protein